MTQEIAVRNHADVAALNDLEGILLGEKELPEIVDDPADIQREIMAQLLSAESDAELESVGSATGWRELAGIPMELHGFRWRPSSFEEGAAVFFVVDATRLDTGQRVALTTGSGNILAQLVNMARRNTLVGSVRALEIADRETKSGFRPNWLRTPPEALVDKAKEKGAEKAGVDAA
jgi:hypothetical protein